jgi:aminoglycoside/choline kinase family phosphotransferase
MTIASDRPDLNPTDWRTVETLTGDASTRAYRRVTDAGGGTAVLVEYDADALGQIGRDLEVLTWCRERGLPVPGVLASDLEHGRAVLEDFGSCDAETALAAASPAERPTVMRRAIGPLGRLARWRPDELPRWNAPLDEPRLRWELAGFELWYMAHRRGLRPAPEIGRWLDRLAAEVGRHPRRVCHRDYHLNNLMIRPDGSIGVIDVQDIVVGPDSYDAVSLLFERAALELLTPAHTAALLDDWAGTTAAAPGWRGRAATTRLQRGLKVLGTFARFVAAGRTRYEAWLTRLETDLLRPLEAAGAPFPLLDAVTSVDTNPRDIDELG